MSPVKRYEKTIQMSVRIPEELNERATDLVAKMKKTGHRVAVPGVEDPVKSSIAALLLAGFVDELDFWEAVLEGKLKLDAQSGKKVSS